MRGSDLPGFAVLVGKRQKTFIIQGDLRADGKRISPRIKIGNVEIFSTREARAAAKAFLGKIAKGVDPREKAPEPETPKPVKTDLTLRETWDRYHQAHMQRKGRSQKTSSGYRDHIERLLADWLDQPLSKLGENPAFVMKRHDDITLANGPYMANGCMRSLRAIYNHARKTFRSLPVENPVSAVDWNPEKAA